MRLGTASAEQRDEQQVHVLCRMKPGVTLESAQADLERVARQLGHDLPQSYNGSAEDSGSPLESIPARFVFRGPAVLVILQVSVALMLLLACANVSGLFLARVTLRQKEMGIRTELGASRSRLIRQLLTESLLLALMGGLVGLLLAWGMTHLLIEGLAQLSGVDALAPPASTAQASMDACWDSRSW